MMKKLKIVQNYSNSVVNIISFKKMHKKFLFITYHITITAKKNYQSKLTLAQFFTWCCLA